MSAVLQPVTESTDLEAQRSVVPKEAARYLFTPGDYLGPRRRRDLKELRARGGEELDTPCARFTKKFLPRAYITPLTKGVDDMPAKYVPEGADTLPHPQVGLVNVVRYPGLDITPIVHSASGERKGVIEVETLRALDWTYNADGQPTGKAYRLQHLIFPADWPLPVTLRGIEERIKEADREHKLVSGLADELLESCVEFREWGLGHLDKEHSRLQQRVSHQWTHFYSPLALTLLEQLEVARQDQALNELAKSQSQMMNKAFEQSGITPEILTQLDESRMAQFQQLMEANNKAMIEGFKSIVEGITKQKAK